MNISGAFSCEKKDLLVYEVLFIRLRDSPSECWQQNRLFWFLLTSLQFLSVFVNASHFRVELACRQKPNVPACALVIFVLVHSAYLYTNRNQRSAGISSTGI